MSYLQVVLHLSSEQVLDRRRRDEIERPSASENREAVHSHPEVDCCCLWMRGTGLSHDLECHVEGTEAVLAKTLP